MAGDHIKLDIVNENHKDSDNHVDKEVERIFGKPAVHRPTPNNNSMLNRERNHYDTDNNNHIGTDSTLPSQPLLEPNREKQLPPLAGPEIDDLDGDPPKNAAPYPGIDDGLLEHPDQKPENSNHDGSEHNGTDPETAGEHHLTRTHSFTDGKLPWEHDEPDFPYEGGISRFGGVDDRGLSPVPGVIPDVNTYQQKKNLAQGMMDLALLSANANQLRYVLESSSTHDYYYSSVIFICLSIILQILVGVGLIMNSRYDVREHKDICKADKINNMTVLGIFLITIVNVFITSFSVPAPVPTNIPQIPQSSMPIIKT